MAPRLVSEPTVGRGANLRLMCQGNVSLVAVKVFTHSRRCYVR